jgi:hypothetical protein
VDRLFEPGNAGASEPISVWLDETHGNYALHFGPNPNCPQTGLIAAPTSIADSPLPRQSMAKELGKMSRRDQFRMHPYNEDLATQFWQKYIDNSNKSKMPVRMFYPEPQFFQDDHGIYLRNPELSGEGRIDFKEMFSHLNIPGRLEESFSFVPAGIVRALVYLSGFFYGSSEKFVG